MRRLVAVLVVAALTFIVAPASEANTGPNCRTLRTWLRQAHSAYQVGWVTGDSFAMGQGPQQLSSVTYWIKSPATLRWIQLMQAAQWDERNDSAEYFLALDRMARGRC